MFLIFGEDWIWGSSVELGSILSLKKINDGKRCIFPVNMKMYWTTCSKKKTVKIWNFKSFSARKRATILSLQSKIPPIPHCIKRLYFINWVNICLFAGKIYFQLGINIYCAFLRKQEEIWIYSFFVYLKAEGKSLFK
jgi:hypothetical protein